MVMRRIRSGIMGVILRMEKGRGRSRVVIDSSEFRVMVARFVR